MKTKQKTDAKRIKPKFNSLYEIFNFGKNKYKTSSLTEYKKYIEQMNFGDLQVHAVELGLKPSRNRIMLEKTLLNTFSKNIGNMLPPINGENKIKNEKQILEILARGK